MTEFKLVNVVDNEEIDMERALHSMHKSMWDRGNALMEQFWMLVHEAGSANLDQIKMDACYGIIKAYTPSGALFAAPAMILQLRTEFFPFLLVELLEIRECLLVIEAQLRPEKPDTADVTRLLHDSIEKLMQCHVCEFQTLH